MSGGEWLAFFYLRFCDRGLEQVRGADIRHGVPSCFSDLAQMTLWNCPKSDRKGPKIWNCGGWLDQTFVWTALCGGLGRGCFSSWIGAASGWRVGRVSFYFSRRLWRLGWISLGGNSATSMGALCGLGNVIGASCGICTANAVVSH